MEPARSDEIPDPAPGAPEPPRATPAAGVPALWPWTFSDRSLHIPVVGPTQALTGRAGDPGRTVPTGEARGLPGSGQRPVWRIAHQAWQESGIRWEPAAFDAGSDPAPDQDPDPGPPRDADPGPPGRYRSPGLGSGTANGGRGAIWRGGASGRITFGSSGVWPGEQEPEAMAPGLAEPVKPGEFPLDAGYAERQGTGWSDYPQGGFPGQSWPSGDALRAPAEDPALGTMPLGAPVVDAPGSEADELFRAWQGSVREAVAPRRIMPAPWRGSPAARRRALQAVAIGVPAAVIVTVGVGALMMLTGRANEMLAVQGNTGTRSPGAALSPASSASAGVFASAGTPGAVRVTAPASLAGYPGQRGTVTAGAMGTAAGVSIAVGGADGHPAIWRRRGGGGWTLESAPVLGSVPGTGKLTAIAHGPDGWLAVGSVSGGGTTAPLVVASTDGVSWQPVSSLAGRTVPGVAFAGVAAGPGGYAVVGRQETGGRIFAILWWSPDLRTWTAGGNGNLDGRLLASTANAAAAVGAGFVAVGSHGPFLAVWTSPDGQHWTLHDISAWPGVRTAALGAVAVTGSRVVAAGYAVTQASEVPVAVVSADGGAHWRTAVLPAPGGSGRVTALTATGDGFVAAGLAGPAGAQQAVIWTSRDGMTWSAAIPVSAGGGEITALNSAGATITGADMAGASASVVTLKLR